MSWQPLQVATNLCLLGPSGHSFSVYCACATGAPRTTMANNKINESPRIMILPRASCVTKPHRYSLGSASLPFRHPSSLGGAGMQGLSVTSLQLCDDTDMRRI